MSFPIFNRKKILNISHRGLEKKYPENTLVSFNMGLAEGADGIEFDVQITKDSQLVLVHDPTLGRTTNGSGKVNQKTLEEIRKLDAGSWFSPRFSGERVPTLDEAFRELPKDAIFNIELKPFRRISEVARKTIAVIRKYRAQDRVIISSFNPFIVRYCKSLDPDVPVMFLHPHKWLEIAVSRILSLGLRPDAECFEWFVLKERPEIVAELKKRGIIVFAGTTEKEEHMRLMKNLGVDGIITTDPRLLNRVLGEDEQKLFIYGSLKNPDVQLRVFGRMAKGTPDVLEGYKRSEIQIGNESYPIVVFDNNGSVAGLIIGVNAEELKKIDEYETDAYKRERVRLASGVLAWVYVKR